MNLKFPKSVVRDAAIQALNIRHEVRNEIWEEKVQKAMRPRFFGLFPRTREQAEKKLRSVGCGILSQYDITFGFYGAAEIRRLELIKDSCFGDGEVCLDFKDVEMLGLKKYEE